MKFRKALKRAVDMAYDKEYCAFIYRENKNNMLGFEVDGTKITPINIETKKPTIKRSFRIKDFLADDWIVINAYGEEC